MISFTYPPVLIELVCVALVLVLVLASPRALPARIAALEARLPSLPRSLGMQILLIALAAILLRAAFLPWLGAPVPLFHDEQSLTLQAQTFLKGRLAMPPHELWRRFESFHINQLPAYASIYFPGRSLPLALGMLFADNAWVGVWISFVLFAMATVWMLRGWIEPHWAFVGGLIVVVRYGAFSYWINSYWGGAFTALGAMLVVGTLPRILKAPRWSHGVAMGLGAAILMTTRPYEGFVLCAAIGVFFLPRIWRSARPRLQPVLMRIGLPLATIVAGALAWMLAYNSAATGDPLLTPYELNRTTYAVAPPFNIAPTVQGVDRIAPMAEHVSRFYYYEARPYRDARRGIKGYIKTMVRKIEVTWDFYVGLALTIPFLLGLWASRRDVPLLGTLVVFYLGYFLTTWRLPHYAAPIIPIIMIIVMRGLKSLRGHSRGGATRGFALSRLLPLAAATPLLVGAGNVIAGWPDMPSNSVDRPCCAVLQSSVRTDLIERLSRVPGRDLVLVASSENNPIHSELVYNDADIDASPIVFAHSMALDRDRDIIAYYPDRRVWLLEWTPEARGFDQNALRGTTMGVEYTLKLLPEGAGG